LWRAVGIRERGFLRDMVKGMCGVEVRCCVPFEGAGGVGGEIKERM
jgi:hypothetical protein